MNNVRETLGERLKNEREKNNLTQEEFGKKFNLNKQYISYYENGKREPSIDLIVGFAKELKVSTDYLLGNSDYRTTQEEQLASKDILTQEAINKLLELTPEVKSFFLDTLMSNNKFFDYIKMLFHCVTFPYKDLMNWEIPYAQAIKKEPEKDDTLLRKRWLEDIYITDKSKLLFDDLINKMKKDGE